MERQFTSGEGKDKPRQEKRHRKRFVVEGMEIRGKMMFATEVRVLNISVSGIAVKADRRLDIGSDYMLKLIEGDKTMSLRGKVVWSSISGSREGPRGEMVPVYTAGLKFTDRASDEISELASFIGMHVNGNDHRVGGLRVAITGAEKAILDYPSQYRVTRLSLSGMQIKSAQLIKADARFPMEMSLPEEGPIRFTGRVTSCRHVHDEGLDHYDVGIAFMNMTEKDIERLREFISILLNMNDIA
jgi:hypothetical protein